MKRLRLTSWLLVYLAAVLLSGLLGPFLQAQSTTQTIQGLVTDSTGSVIPGASITITNLATGVAITTTTNQTGNYSFQLVPVGNYRITCRMDGFKTETVADIRVETGGQPRQNFAMEIGDVTETVEVLASAVLLNTENAVVGGVIENRRIIELPLNGRNVAQLAVLIPGVQFGQRSGMSDGLGGFPIPGHSFSVSANGVRELHQVVSLDGVDAKDPRIHITNFVPSIEALEEFKIQTNAYSAEYGFGGGAQVTMTMKSGTNEIHGTLFEFLRNDALDAENYFLNFERSPDAERVEKDALRRNQFGVVVSGPIVRNKTFWAFNWEARRERVETVQTAWFPDDNFRQGDFSELATGTINPANGKLFRAPILIYDAFTSEPFPNNIVPQNRLHPGALNVNEQFLPRASFRQADPLDFTARAGVKQPIDTNQYFGRVDHHFSDYDRIFGRIAIDRSSRDSININPNFPRFVDSRVTNFASQWVHTFNQSTINELRFGFNTVEDDTAGPRTNDESFDMDALGIGKYRVVADSNAKLSPRNHGVPRIGFTMGENIQGNGFDRMDTIQVGDHLSVIKGSHNLKMGAEHYYLQFDRGAGNNQQGRLTFRGNESGNDFASWLLGVPNRTETPAGLALSFPRAGRSGAYIMDDWKATPKLTINLGLRVDYNGNPRDAMGRFRALNLPGESSDPDGRGVGFTTPDGEVIPMMTPEFVDERGNVKLFRQQLKFFMPRVGIAYRPTDKWVIRTGAGWLDNIMHQNTFTILANNPPKGGFLQFRAVTNSAQTIALTGADGNTYNVRTRQFREGRPILTLDDPFLAELTGADVPRPTNITTISPDYKDGYIWKWSFDVQRELPHNVALTVGYVGSKGTNIGNSYRSFNNARPSPDTDAQSRQPYQKIYDPATPELGIQDLAQIRMVESAGESFHHGLQVKLDKRYSRGLALGLAYTWSRSHGDGEAGGNQTFNFQDPRDRLGSRGRFRFDQRQVLVAHYVWEIPGSNLPGTLKHILGGWQSNGILSLRTGFPFTPKLGGDPLNLGRGSEQRPDRTADGELGSANRKLWFDPQAFSRVTCNIPERLDLCRFGNSGNNILDSPGQKNLDLSLFKNFQVTEQVRVQFRSEFFNAFNTPYFGEPNGIRFTTNDSIAPDGPRMGEIRRLRTPMRIIQFGLKLFF